jgi:hypothetical protein
LLHFRAFSSLFCSREVKNVKKNIVSKEEEVGEKEEFKSAN